MAVSMKKGFFRTAKLYMISDKITVYETFAFFIRITLLLSSCKVLEPSKPPEVLKRAIKSGTAKAHFEKNKHKVFIHFLTPKIDHSFQINCVLDRVEHLYYLYSGQENVRKLKKLFSQN